MVAFFFFPFFPFHLCVGVCSKLYKNSNKVINNTTLVCLTISDTNPFPFLSKMLKCHRMLINNYFFTFIICFSCLDFLKAKQKNMKIWKLKMHIKLFSGTITQTRYRGQPNLRFPTRYLIYIEVLFLCKDLISFDKLS